VNSEFKPTESIKVVPPPPELSGGVTDDSKAKQEEAAFAGFNYDDLAKKNDHGRRERVRDHLLRAVLIIFWLLIALTVSAILIYGYHQFMPTGWHWLTERQIDKLQTIIFSGAIAGFMGNVAKRYLN
jgi:hypothetical protein